MFRHDSKRLYRPDGLYCPATKTIYLNLNTDNIKNIVKVLNHEILHYILHMYIGEEECWLYDNIAYELEEWLWRE